METQEKLLSIGKILNFHGISGEVKVGYTPGNESQLAELKEVYAVINDKTVKLTINKINFHKKSALIKFNEINSVNEVLELKGALLKIEKDKLQKTLDEDEFYIDDLVGLDVYTQDSELLGRVKFVGNQGGGSILSIHDSENHEFLVPFVKDLVPTVDVKNKKIVINNIPGLIEK